MDTKLEPGKYVIAVSGGVDSIVLLDLLAKKVKSNTKDYELVIAHFDHGIRPDSSEDRKLVGKLAKSYGLPFEYLEGKLAPSTSEATAREARYNFLNQIQQKYSARALITAHHQDDLIETAIINWLRGTDRKGLSSLQSSNELRRPLLGTTKQQIKSYALKNNLEWREDATNSDEKYLRNYVRKQIIPKLSKKDRIKLIDIINQAAHSNIEIDTKLRSLLNRSDPLILDKKLITSLPHAVAKEAMAAWLRQNNLELDRRLLERLVVAAKTYQIGKQADINKNLAMQVKKESLALVRVDR